MLRDIRFRLFLLTSLTMIGILPAQAQIPHTLQDILLPSKAESHFPQQEIVISELGKDSDPWLAKDKAKHFLAGMVLQLNSYFVYTRIGEGNRKSGRSVSAGITIGISVGKEIADQRQPGNHFCWKDLTMDMMGMVSGIFIISNWE